MKTIIKISLIFIIGLILGIIIGVFLPQVLNKNEYFTLKKDYCIENTGTIKVGTHLKFDKAFSEGFTRYVLYINIKGEDLEFYPQKREDIIIPYWLIPDSICE